MSTEPVSSLTVLGSVTSASSFVMVDTGGSQAQMPLMQAYIVSGQTVDGTLTFSANATTITSSAWLGNVAFTPDSSLTGAGTVTLPGGTSNAKAFIINNTSSYTLTVGGTGSSVVVNAGVKALIKYTGTSVGCYIVASTAVQAPVLAVTVGTTTISSVSSLTFTGSGVTSISGSTGSATVTFSGGGTSSGITLEQGTTTLTGITTLELSTGITLSSSGGTSTVATLSAGGGSGNPNAYDPYTGLSTSTTYSVPPLSDWTWVNQGSSTATQATGGPIVITSPGSSTEELYFIGFAPVSGNWTYTFMLSGVTCPPFPDCGVGIGLTDGTKFIFLGFEYLGGSNYNFGLVLQTFNSTTSLNSTIGGSLLFAATSPILFLRMQYDGTNIICSFAYNAQGPWIPAYETAASFLSSLSKIGLLTFPYAATFSYSDYQIGASLYHVTQTNP